MPKITYPPVYIDPNLDKPGFNPKRPNAEKLIYDALQLLGDDYYVFHSYRWQGSFNGRYKNGENDFMVYHPKLGILIIEVKGGNIEFVNTQWQRKHYNGNIDVLYGGKDPVNQLLQARGTLINILKDKLKLRDLTIPVNIAVWFPNSSFETKENNLPLKPNQILDQKTLLNPEEAIISIFEGSRKVEIKEKLLLRTLLPTLNIVSDFKLDQEARTQKMIMLTKGQSSVLDFTEYQSHTAIRGSAGTGKTVIAEEKVRRLQSQYPDDKILFLCFNRALKDVLEKKFKKDENVNAINYDSLTVQMADQSFIDSNYGNFDAMRQHFYYKVLAMNSFPYQHIIIDEAQDFEEDWIELLAITQPKHFYLFYDRNQDIFHDKKNVPNWMVDIDCRLSLHTNCRNTKEIAHFANCHISPLRHNTKELVLNGVEGNSKPHIVFYKDLNTIKSFIAKKVAEWHSEGVSVEDNCRIVSLRTSRGNINNSRKSISKALGIDKNLYKQKSILKTVNIPVISSSKIKGLESNYIFLIDVSVDQYKDESFLKRMYVASSRAKHELYIFIEHTENKDDLKNALDTIRATNMKGIKTSKQLLNKFVKTLGCTYK